MLSCSRSCAINDSQSQSRQTPPPNRGQRQAGATHMPWGLAAGYPAKRLCLRWPSLIGAVDPFFALGGDPRRHGMVEFEAHPASVPVARQQSLVAVGGWPPRGGGGAGRGEPPGPLPPPLL